MKILLVCKSEYRYSFPAVAERLKSLFGCEIAAMTFTTPSTRMMEQTGVFSEVHNLAAYLKKFVDEHDLEECIKLLRETRFAETLNSMVYADRIIMRYPFERVIRILAGINGFWEGLLRQLRPDAIIGEIACATEWIAYCVATGLNIPYLAPYPTPVGKRVFFVRSPQGHWEEAEQRYQEIKRKDLAPEEEKIAAEFLREFRARKAKPPSLKTALRSPFHVEPDQFAGRIKRIPFRVRSWLEDGYFEVGSYHGTPPWEPVLHDVVRGFRHLANENFVFKKEIPPGRKVYFPLHVQPEYTTDVRAPFLTNQPALIDAIAKSVPIGYRVVVKEHPGMKGLRRSSYYRQFSKSYNVDLVSPSVDGHDLILGSDVNLTISGTTAWESILYEKPVIAFARLCYSYFDLVVHCDNMSDLPYLISGTIRDFRPNRNLLLKFIWSFLDTAHTFQWGNALSTPSVAEDENVDRIAKAIFFEAQGGRRLKADPVSVSA
ncbi:MAG: hypothetical protein WB992_17110 [Bryobacteraceae bacterium]